jgi:phosphate transport system substrate-binding protein
MTRLTRRGMLAVALAMPAVARPNAPGLRIGGTGAALGGMQALGALRPPGAPAITIVPNLGTIGGIRAVAAGAVEVSIAARPINDAERASGLLSRHYADTPLVFATHRATGATDVRLADAVGMFDGSIMAWPNGTPVRPARRPNLDADTVLLTTLSPAMALAVATLQQRPGLRTAGSDHDQIKALEALPGSFGVIALALVLSEQRLVQVLTLDGRAPDAAGWPMMKKLHAVIRADAPAHVTDFISSLFDADHAALLSGLGHVMAGPA